MSELLTDVAPSTSELVLVCPGDASPRARPGDRLHRLFEEQCDRLREQDDRCRLAVDGPLGALTYDEVDRRANRLARFLLSRGLGPGDRVGLLFDRALDGYLAMLAVSKIHGAYVPLDPGFPADRLAYIVGDSGARAVLSVTRLTGLLDLVDAEIVPLDATEHEVSALDGARLSSRELGPPVDDLCYIIYTSGSTGRPKGVAIEHASICSFVRVAAEVYGLTADDRVYQGMTIAFDFSVEEIWVPWIAGATLVPKPGHANLIGPDLETHLREHRVSALVCVPTLLETLDEQRTDLRFVLVSGESCPRDLVQRWHRPGRRFLNVYGPTEATVTATWTPVHPDRPVTIGVPLPTYSVVILDPESDRALPRGVSGEIGIAGIGLAAGYVNRPDLTQKAFIPDFLGIPDNPSERIYRTGDLGRVTADGEIEFLGRIDTQVKVRGYRIELTEIESVLMEAPGVAQAVVHTFEPEPGEIELVAYFSARDGISDLDTDAIAVHLRGRLPAYMVPAYLEPLATIPMLPSGKADRKSLPAPSGRRASGSDDTFVAPATDAEAALAEVLARVLRLDRVSVDSHFFDDLGANSLLMARFCAQARGRADLRSPISMRDVYVHPTIRDLADAMTGGGDPATSPAAATAPPGLAAPKARKRPRSAQHVAFGAVQALALIAATGLLAFASHELYWWVTQPEDFLGLYLRAVAGGGIGFVVLVGLPIAAKWALVGRWKECEIPLWSARHLRFWVVKSLLQMSPILLFAGSPLFTLYLRALGAHVGRGALVLSRRAPVCADLLTIGAGAVVRKDAAFSCYRAEPGYIRTGPVTIGRDAVVGEASVLDVFTSLGDGAQLGHASGLLAGQAVPDGQSWHGAPAQRADVDYRELPSRELAPWRPVVFAVLQLANRLLGTVPLLLALGVMVADLVLHYGWLSPEVQPSPTDAAFYGRELAISFVVFFGGLVVELLLVLTYPRLLNLAMRADRVYPLYGIHYSLQRTIAALTNVKRPLTLFGDSSAIVHYLRALGYDLGRILQTGSNFGVAQKHESPYLCSVGRGTMVSDGLSFMNAVHSSTSFKVSRTTIGSDCFLGNAISYPPGARIGSDVLLGTKVMVPIDGPVREGVGLLGSPSFEIPRSVQRDSAFDRYKEPETLARRLHAKNRHNLGTALLFLLVRWMSVFATVLIATSAFALEAPTGGWSVIAAGPVLFVFTLAYFVLIERASLGFRALQPRFCSIYDEAFWRHERFWKLMTGPAGVLNGTPMKTVVWRALGVRMGRRVFDDGCGIPEKTLVTIGDDCVLNAGTTIQCHSLEDGTFKSEPTVLGNRCTLGPGSFVHYGVRLEDDSVLEADAFLMKGSEVTPGSRWLGNPAREAPATSAPHVANPPPAVRPSVPRVDVANGLLPPGATSPTPAGPAEALLLDELRAAPARVPDGLSGATLSVFSLAACRRREAELLAFASRDERAWALGMRSPERRSTFLISRALLRLVLSAGRPDVAPGDWQLVRDASGKVMVHPRDAALDVSISHTTGAVAIAVSANADVGVDLEPLDWHLDPEVVASVLSEAEVAAVRSLPSADLAAAFLRHWTLKEAVAKSVGAGTAVDFRAVQVRVSPMSVLADGRGGSRSDYEAYAVDDVVDGRLHVLSMVVRRRE